MGMYLSKPNTEKHLSDDSNEKLNCGTSSMQGWRNSQEDAHNCIIDFDKDTSYFAVYDGHGGKVVSLYCAQELPNFLKELDSYKSGNIEKALEEAFLQFDASLLTKETITKLVKLRCAAYKDSSGSDCEEENVDSLYKEAMMPIEELVEKYKKGEIYKTKTENTKEDPPSSSKGSSASSTSNIKPESSEDAVSTSSSTNKVTNTKEDDPIQQTPDCSESKEVSNSSPKDDNNIDLPDSSGAAQEVCTPSNNIANEKITTQNGEIESTQNCESSSKSEVSSSSTTPHENGEVPVKKGKGKAVTKTKGVVPKSPSVQRPKRKTNQGEFGQIPLDCSDDESEDEKDETFEGPDEDTTMDDSSEDEEYDEVSSSPRDSEDTSTEDEEDEEEEDAKFRMARKLLAANRIKGPAVDCGTTAVVALLRGNELYVANAGDSRCVVCRNGEAIEMSIDHKPNDELEFERIKKAGSWISSDARVDGGLNLSRAIGDHGYKKQKDLSQREQAVTALPDVKTLTIDPSQDEFIVLACDGIWNVLSSQETVDFIRTRIQKGQEKMSVICEELFDHCLAPDRDFSTDKGCDNMTAVIVQFKSAKSRKKPLSDSDAEESQCKKNKLDEEEVAA
ncbi:hypothetical protein AMK59_5508 [Oryctes borbonicus]|uniref:protein-serine/threonine phosphatase n=1 Tax=Oryctes borbonicus TaxID=1629725 RepID=A0A0T6B3M5_9SCAR|nr:hypothetical protein AMK59_5508 [Oryctes borbonicus]